MRELIKIRDVVQRQIPDAPQEVILVLDATTGQNAISQASMFAEAVNVTGIMLAKLDGTAKGGIASLTLNQAAELARYGITANALAPSARTGMTEEVFADMMKKPEQGFDHFDPANVAPLVVWLGSAASGDVSGRIFEVEGGKISIADGWRSTEPVDKGARWEPAEVGSAVEQLLARVTPPQKVYGT